MHAFFSAWWAVSTIRELSKSIPAAESYIETQRLTEAAPWHAPSWIPVQPYSMLTRAEPRCSELKQWQDSTRLDSTHPFRCHSTCIRHHSAIASHVSSSNSPVANAPWSPQDQSESKWRVASHSMAPTNAGMWASEHIICLLMKVTGFRS